MKLLLHTCCAPCTSALIRSSVFSREESRPVFFWYNPNIHPYTEYRSRRDSLAAFARDLGLELLMEDEYGLREFIQALYSKEGPRGNRCHFCYRLRLEATAREAAGKGYQAFSTSLLCSPFQNHDLIRQIGEECAREYKLGFFYRDFRPWFNEGKKMAREKGSYMQKYCGCIFSEEERYSQLI